MVQKSRLLTSDINITNL